MVNEPATTSCECGRDIWCSYCIACEAHCLTETGAACKEIATLRAENAAPDGEPWKDRANRLMANLEAAYNENAAINGEVERLRSLLDGDRCENCYQTEKERDDLRAALLSEQVDTRMLRAYILAVHPDTADFDRWLQHAHAAKEWREHRALRKQEPAPHPTGESGVSPDDILRNFGRKP